MSVKEKIDAQSIAVYNEYLEPMKKMRKNQETGMIIFFLVCVVLGLVIGIGAGVLEDSEVIHLEGMKPFDLKEGWGFLYFIILMIYYFVTMLLHTIIHEAGHLVFGLLSGYRFLSFRVFSFTIVRKDGNLSVKKLKVPGTMGQCLMYPPQWEEDQPYPYVLYNLGGGFLNAIVSILMVPLFFLNSPLLAWIAGVFIFTGVIYVVTNLVPMTIGIPNDGKNCLDCKRFKEARRGFYLQLKINADMSDGAELTDFPVETFQVQEPEGKKISALISYLPLQEYFWYLANKREEEAEAALTSLEQKKDKMIMAYVNTIDLERLYFLILQKAPIEQIAAYYTVLRALFQQNTDLSVLRVKYAYYLMLSEEEREKAEWLAFSKKGRLPKKLPKQKKPVTAEKIYEAMLEGAKKHPVAGEAKLYMQLVEEIKERNKDDN